jgi:hypothetical protein
MLPALENTAGILIIHEFGAGFSRAARTIAALFCVPAVEQHN